jgi:hypothetical protein
MYHVAALAVAALSVIVPLLVFSVLNDSSSSPSSWNYASLVRSTVNPDARNMDDCDPVEDADTVALAKLRCPPFVPTDVDLFTPQAYPSGGGPTAPAGPRPWTEDGLRDELFLIFRRRFPTDESAVCASLALFDDPLLRNYVPDPRLRAAFVVLKGTLAEGAIDAIRSGIFDSVSFALLPDDITAFSVRFANGSQIIQLHSKNEFEAIPLLATILAHEVLHQDADRSCREERMILTLEAFLYGELVAEDPSLAHSRTNQTRRSNTMLMALLNSRSAQGQLRVNESQGNVFPGGTPLDSFYAAFTCFDGGVSSVGSLTLQSFVLRTTGIAVANAAFDPATEEIIDHHQTVLSPAEIVRIAEAGLRLNASCIGSSHESADGWTSDHSPYSSSFSPSLSSILSLTVFWFLQLVMLGWAF